MSMNRRQFLIGTGIAFGAMSYWPRWSFAKTTGDARLIVMVLRGALDGLAAVPPHGDGHYQLARGGLALPSVGSEKGILNLDGFFGLHANLPHFHKLYNDKELLIAHAVATSYRDRSHFDAQKLLENGTNHPLGSDDGWLNRALMHIPDAERAQPFATA
ncbi:MAG: hypothetical protein HKM24_04915, partial [Gammaproteobacteria bacterium]|nr:hypothetical protein [Gammaproteobacteria bacterium]